MIPSAPSRGICRCGISWQRSRVATHATTWSTWRLTLTDETRRSVRCAEQPRKLLRCNGRPQRRRVWSCGNFERAAYRLRISRRCWGSVRVGFPNWQRPKGRDKPGCRSAKRQPGSSWLGGGGFGALALHPALRALLGVERLHREGLLIHAADLARRRLRRVGGSCRRRLGLTPRARDEVEICR